ncbi:hypothetical protein Tco_1411344, partial [Tanacetum coccineum]
MKSSSQFMERNIKKSDHVKNFKWVDGVLLVEDQIRNLKEKVYAGSHEPDLSFFEVLFNTVQYLKKEIVDPESMLPSGKLPSPPLEKLLVVMGLLRISETYSIILIVLLPYSLKEGDSPSGITDSSFEDGVQRALVVGDYKGQLHREGNWTLLCDTLASRLIVAANTLAATICYICVRNNNKMVEMWSKNVASECEGKSYVDLLQ